MTTFAKATWVSEGHCAIDQWELVSTTAGKRIFFFFSLAIRLLMRRLLKLGSLGGGVVSRDESSYTFDALFLF